jgi:hypothetical protein
LLDVITTSLLFDSHVSSNLVLSITIFLIKQMYMYGLFTHWRCKD